MICDLDQARLERSFAYLVEHYMPVAASGSDPVKGNKNSLVTAVADFVEGAEDFCAERVAEIDRDLERRDAYTLSFLRDHFARRTLEE